MVAGRLCASVVALGVQVGTNYANDYSDGVRGTDEARVGPFRLTASGLARPAQVRSAALVALRRRRRRPGSRSRPRTSWWLVAVGLACFVAGWLYTGGPKPYGYLGLGELFVFVFFGLVATAGSAYVQHGRLTRGWRWPRRSRWACSRSRLLEANNLRDVAGDAGRPSAPWPCGWGRAGPVALRGRPRAQLRDRRARSAGGGRSPPSR